MECCKHRKSWFTCWLRLDSCTIRRLISLWKLFVGLLKTNFRWIEQKALVWNGWIEPFSFRCKVIKINGEHAFYWPKTTKNMAFCLLNVCYTKVIWQFLIPLVTPLECMIFNLRAGKPKFCLTWTLRPSKPKHFCKTIDRHFLLFSPKIAATKTNETFQASKWLNSILSS